MATPEATERYFQQLNDGPLGENGTRLLGPTSFRVASAGFGGYRVDLHNKAHRKALEHALLHGINLIDTSSNYTDGESERLVGEMLEKLVHDGRIERDAVVIVSKVGYIQGNNLELATQREKEGDPFPEVVKFMEGCWHCIHPEFLEDQLERTLERLQQDAVDIYLLHNPEYFLSDAMRRGKGDLGAVRDAYYERIALAFDWMEEKVAEGRIRWYGISSNTFVSSAEDPEFTSLEHVIRVAESVGRDARFGVIQFPMNPIETAAATLRNQESGTKTLLELARERGLATLVNRPLNAAAKNGMVRLANFRTTESKRVDSEFQKRKTALAAAESQFRTDFLPRLPPQMPRQHLEQVFSLSKQLATSREAFGTWENWDHVKQTAVLPQIQSILGYLNQLLRAQSGWHTWASAYLAALDEFLDTISWGYENTAQERSKRISAQLDRLAPALAESQTLSQKAVRLLRSVEGVDCVLVGMRKVDYVEDVLSALRRPVVCGAEAVLKEPLSKAIR